MEKGYNLSGHHLWILKEYAGSNNEIKKLILGVTLRKYGSECTNETPNHSKLWGIKIHEELVE